MVYVHHEINIYVFFTIDLQQNDKRISKINNKIDLYLKKENTNKLWSQSIHMHYVSIMAPKLHKTKVDSNFNPLLSFYIYKKEFSMFNHKKPYQIANIKSELLDIISCELLSHNIKMMEKTGCTK